MLAQKANSYQSVFLFRNLSENGYSDFMIQFGQIHELEVLTITDFGVYLIAEDSGEILLPNKHIPEALSVGDKISVFLYFDSEDRPVATTQIPNALVGEFAYLKVIDNSPIGAFMDWGLDKDLLVPFSGQHRPMKLDQSYLVYLYLDKINGRIVGSSKVDKYIDKSMPHDFEPGQEVDLIIANSTDLGYKAVINRKHWGVLYENEVFQRLSFGQHIKGFIKQVRPDGKIDLILQIGQTSRDENAQKIISYLEEQNGTALLSDKSDPKLISDLFGMSKGAFKKTIGALYKQKIINIEKDRINIEL